MYWCKELLKFMHSIFIIYVELFEDFFHFLPPLLHNQSWDLALPLGEISRQISKLFGSFCSVGPTLVIAKSSQLELCNWKGPPVPTLAKLSRQKKTFVINSNSHFHNIFCKLLLIFQIIRQKNKKNQGLSKRVYIKYEMNDPSSH